MKGFSMFYKFDLFIDFDGILCVGGCFRCVNLIDEIKFFIIFLWNSYIMMLIVKYFYECVSY